jgi:hypothetical protein
MTGSDVIGGKRKADSRLAAGDLNNLDVALKIVRRVCLCARLDNRFGKTLRLSFRYFKFSSRNPSPHVGNCRNDIYQSI